MGAEIGICQWFDYEDRAEVDRRVVLLDEAGIRHLRTGVSWADWNAKVAIEAE